MKRDLADSISSHTHRQQQVPSLVVPTPNVMIDDVEGGALPTSVLLCGKGNADKALLEVGMALEEALQRTSPSA
jgi:Asp-tRNA(Asn)/Glu-tRNA(Gln) amidotransferase A subunit family amidase